MNAFLQVLKKGRLFGVKARPIYQAANRRAVALELKRC